MRWLEMEENYVSEIEPKCKIDEGSRIHRWTAEKDCDCGAARGGQEDVILDEEAERRWVLPLHVFENTVDRTFQSFDRAVFQEGSRNA